MQKFVTTLFLLMTLRCAWAASPASAARDIINQFQQGVAARDLAAVEKLVDPAIVVFENGHRNDGWPDFRDKHLKPEFEEPAPQSKWELVRIEATPEMAWGYTKQIVPVTRKSGEKLELLVWSVYVLRKTTGWKIVSLSWSIGPNRR
jgi:ketosteroid isomerase-like protein